MSSGKNESKRKRGSRTKGSTNNRNCNGPASGTLSLTRTNPRAAIAGSATHRPTGDIGSNREPSNHPSLPPRTCSGRPRVGLGDDTQEWVPASKADTSVGTGELVDTGAETWWTRLSLAIGGRDG